MFRMEAGRNEYTDFKKPKQSTFQNQCSSIRTLSSPGNIDLSGILRRWETEVYQTLLPKRRESKNKRNQKAKVKKEEK